MKLKTHLRNAYEAVNHRSLQGVTAVAATIAASSASADDTGGSIPGGDGAAEDAFTTIQDEATSMIESAWPVLVAITGGFILMKLGKRAMNKAT